MLSEMLDSGGGQREPKSKEPMTGEFKELPGFSRPPQEPHREAGCWSRKNKAAWLLFLDVRVSLVKVSCLSVEELPFQLLSR